MSLKWSLVRSLSTACLALAALTSAVAPARAAVVVASFDPAFGPAIPNLGFRGTAEFFIPDACFAIAGAVLNGNACSGNTMSLTTASVEFYNLADPFTPLLTTVFPGAGFTVLGAFFAGGVLTGIDTNISVPEAVNINDAGPPPVSFTGLMGLQFSIGEEGGARLFICDPGNLLVCTDPAGSNVATATYTRVPEPATALLVALALGAAGFARRKA
jgi:PEP-CTERM motif